MLKKSELNSKWFFGDMPLALKLLTVFIKGDMLVILPLIIMILLTGFFSLKMALMLLGAYISVRYLGEMIYWIHQQFGDRKYRPYDFGLKKLDNHAIYILYQTVAIAGIMIGLAVVIGVILFIV